MAITGAEVCLLKNCRLIYNYNGERLIFKPLTLHLISLTLIVQSFEKGYLTSGSTFTLIIVKYKKIFYQYCHAPGNLYSLRNEICDFPL